MEIDVALEVLRDQRGAYDLALHGRQASRHLTGEKHASNPGHKKRIDPAHDYCPEDRHHDRGSYGFHRVASLRQPDGMYHNVNRLDPKEGCHDSAQSVDQQVSPQDPYCADCPVAYAAQSKWDQDHDDERIEDDGG